MHYTHLSMKEREVIYYTYTSGFNLTEIAKILERHKSTISREIKRQLQQHPPYEEAEEKITVGRYIIYVLNSHD